MAPRHTDGSAGDANYGTIGQGYASYRQPEPAIAALIDQALGSAKTVLNVGAGAGSYEPLNRTMTAVEPSASMRQQRRPHLVRALDAMAEHLPFPDGCFDACMATFTVHQWGSLDAGLAEMRRVARGSVLILTCDPDLVQRFWLNEYAPDVLATEARRYPSLDRISAVLGGVMDIVPVPIPLDCRDGFNEAYYGTAGRNACWMQRRARRAQLGALSTRRPVTPMSPVCAAPLPMQAGMPATVIFALSRHTMARCGLWLRISNVRPTPSARRRNWSRLTETRGYTP